MGGVYAPYHYPKADPRTQLPLPQQQHHVAQSTFAVIQTALIYNALMTTITYNVLVVVCVIVKMFGGVMRGDTQPLSNPRSNTL